jgi:hypothetical protein
MRDAGAVIGRLSAWRDWAANTAIVRRGMKVFGARLNKGAAAGLLQAVVRQTGRAAAERVAVVLHLSRLAPPAPRPHHRRIARALLQDAADWHEGQLFSLGNGDMVLLCRAAPPTQAAGSWAAPRSRGNVADPATLPEILRRLLRIDTPASTELVSVWPLGTEAARLLDYARERAARREDGIAMDEDFASQTGVVDAIGSLITTVAITDLLQRQTAIVLNAGAEGQGGLRPLFHEVTLSIAALEGRVAATSQANADPFLFRHLATRLDQRMLQALGHEIGRGGALDVSQAAPAVLHLNLTLPGVLSAGFSRLLAAAGRGRIGVEISLLEAVADLDAFVAARARLADSGVALVLDGVSHLALLMTRPGLLGADLLKLDWSPRLADLPAAEQRAIEVMLQEVDLNRIVLHRAETEEALRWGLARGIRRFQGRHVDAMLGASRIVGCPHADACALRQCIERAAATGRIGRAGCHNHALLDAGAPVAADQPARLPHGIWPTEALT